MKPTDFHTHAALDRDLGPSGRGSIRAAGPPTTILVVGGPDRSTRGLADIAAAKGHRVEHHDGSSSRPSRRMLDAMIGRADVVVILTQVNSHAAVLHARDEARRRGVPCLISRRFGPTSLANLLEAMRIRHARAQS